MSVSSLMIIKLPSKNENLPKSSAPRNLAVSIPDKKTIKDFVKFPPSDTIKRLEILLFVIALEVCLIIFLICYSPLLLVCISFHIDF